MASSLVSNLLGYVDTGLVLLWIYTSAPNFSSIFTRSFTVVGIKLWTKCTKQACNLHSCCAYTTVLFCVNKAPKVWCSLICFEVDVILQCYNFKLRLIQVTKPVLKLLHKSFYDLSLRCRSIVFQHHLHRGKVQQLFFSVNAQRKCSSWL